MSHKITKILAGDSTSKSRVSRGEDTLILSSPYFDIDDDKFTDLSVKDSTHRDISGESFEFSIQVKLTDEGELDKVSFSGVETIDLKVKDVYFDGNVLLIEKEDGSVARVLDLNVEVVSMDDLKNRIIRAIIEMIGSDLNEGSSIWEEI